MAGANGGAALSRSPGLVGLATGGDNQALVLDAAAANGAGVVISNAAEGVVGYP